MAHEITERADGTAEAAFALTPAWHGLGTVIAKPQRLTSGEFFVAAQLDWQVAQRRVWYGDVRDNAVLDGGSLANVREDNNILLGYVSPHYQVVQNAEAFAFLDGLQGELAYESAFSLQGGKRVVVTARLPQVDQIVKDDVLQRYLLMALAHDGTAAIRFGVTSVRVVCANTYALALAKDGKAIKELTIRHSGNVQDSLDDARRIIAIANDNFEQHADVCRELAMVRMTGDMWDKFLDIMCPQMPIEDPDWSELRATRIKETRDAITTCYHNDRQTLPGVEGTAWAALNAVTEHIDHLPRRGATRHQKAEARFNVTQYGPGRDQKDRAMRALLRFSDLAVGA